MRVYETEIANSYYIKDRSQWYYMPVKEDNNEREVIVSKTAKPSQSRLTKRKEKPTRNFIKMAEDGWVKIYATRLGLRPSESFNAQGTGYELCGSRMTVKDGIIRKQYRLLDGFNFLVFDIYATDKKICYAEIDYRNDIPMDEVGLNLTLPDPLAMSIEEEEVLDELVLLSKELMANNVIMTKNTMD